MAQKAARKSRKKGPKITVEHAVYGPGVLEEKRITDSGPVLVVAFADGSTRSLLATPSFWLSLPDLAAIPVAKAAAPEPVPEDDDEGDEPVMDEDDAKELVIQ
jgi:hypothetical protein